MRPVLVVTLAASPWPRGRGVKRCDLTSRKTGHKKGQFYGVTKGVARAARHPLVKVQYFALGSLNTCKHRWGTHVGRVEPMTRVENLRVTWRDGRCDAPRGLSFICLTGERHAPSGETDAGERCNISASDHLSHALSPARLPVIFKRRKSGVGMKGELSIMLIQGAGDPFSEAR
ncbi:hypothetical protein E2C01_031152 [Portunus trituberculatus]|uniref:Uncharacterized protein n=1 Tax=Portunus trituberculatus TaxID=210409 RepID=A0A5B7EW44_PORTR|nr:hypothetical protein [Portunus trituberculatus]